MLLSNSNLSTTRTRHRPRSASPGKPMRNGRFRLVVPPGRGTVWFLQTFRRTSLSRLANTRGSPATPISRVKLKAARGKRSQSRISSSQGASSCRFRVVDAAGQPLAGARIEIREPNRLPDSSTGRSDADGRFKVIGLAPEEATIIDIIDERTLPGRHDRNPRGCRGGARAHCRRFFAGSTCAARLARPAESWTRPANRSAGCRGAVLGRELIPAERGRSFGLSVGTLNEINNDGTYTFRPLDPGCSLPHAGRGQRVSERYQRGSDRQTGPTCRF